jgi:hypothetical protein
MSVKLQMEKLAKPGEVLEENKKIGELEEMLKERAEELQVIESFQSCILNKVKETDDELEAIKGVIIEVINGDSPINLLSSFNYC